MAIEQIKSTELLCQFIKQVSAFSDTMGEQFCIDGGNTLLIIATDDVNKEAIYTQHGPEDQLVKSLARTMGANKDFEMLIKEALLLFTINSNAN